MVKIKVTPGTGEAKDHDARPTHEKTVKLKRLDPDAEDLLVFDGIKTRITARQMAGIIDALPDKMNTRETLLVMVNILTAFGQLPKVPSVITGLMIALKHLHEEEPRLFEEGGLEEMKREAEEEDAKKRN